MMQDIRQQEEETFQELDRYEQIESLTPKAGSTPSARDKARKQLAVSSDSPFSKQEERTYGMLKRAKQYKDQKTAMLVDETCELRGRMNHVKRLVAELKDSKSKSEQESSDNLDDRYGNLLPDKAKFRPLTGKADCPNCVCDRRRSVCDQCVKISVQNPRRFSQRRQDSVSLGFSFDDDRPIRPANGQQKSTARDEPLEVDRNVVPGKIYTIGRSLNDRRSKLGQVIDDLLLEIEKFKQQRDRLEKERKLVQMYKSQWKFGPSIGGPKASSRERLGANQQQQKRDYESRHDPNLKRDSRSLMGFRHIGSDLKLRQYHTGSNNNLALGRRQIATRPTSLLSSNRSKSLESLKEPVSAGTKSREDHDSNFYKGQSSSEVNLAADKQSEHETSNKESQEIPDEVEEQIEVEQNNSPEEERPAEESANNEGLREGSVEAEPTSKLVEKPVGGAPKVSWVPVFGETEIKTVRRLPTRKLQIISPPSSAGSNRASRSRPTTLSPRPVPTCNKTPRAPRSILSANNSRREPSSTSGQSRLLAEAEKKLKFASDILAKEQTDSQTKNQLLVNHRIPVARPRRTAVKRPMVGRSKSVSAESKHSDDESSIARIEEMVNEQQRLLNKLASGQVASHPAVVSPITVSCPSPCCHLSPSMAAASSPESSGKSSLMISVKDRLNKTQLRLARRLEEEREKHQQLRLNFDSSIRKQTDLKAENELLKQSLSRCIDTCLKDISNTFESLSDTLSSSIGRHTAPATEGAAKTQLGDAAQLIVENRYLKQLQGHVERLEQQRHDMFEELKKEKQRAHELEMRFREAQTKELASEEQPSTSLAADSMHDHTVSLDASGLDDKSLSEDTITYSSTDVYRQFIESISPDMDAIKRERRMLLDELDNVRKLLSNIEDGQPPELAQ